MTANRRSTGPRLRLVKAALMLALLMTLWPLGTEAGQYDWPTYGGSFARTFRSGASVATDCELQNLWISQGDFISGATNVSAFSAITVLDTLAFLSFWNYMTCFDVRTGARVWTSPHDSFPVYGQDMRCQVTADDSLIYFGGGSFRSYNCARAADGSVVWSHNTLDVPTPLGNTKFCPSVIHDSVVYMASDRVPGEVFAFNKYTGTLFSGWVTNPRLLSEGGVYNAMATDGDSLLFIGSAAESNTLTNGRLYAIRLSDGTEKWTLEDPSAKFLNTTLDREGFTGSLAYENGILYYQSNIRDDASGFDHFPWDGSAGAIDVNAEDGTGAGILWVTPAPVGRALYGGPAIGEDAVYLNSDGIFVSDSNPKGVIAVDKSSGVVLWRNLLDTSGVPMPLAVARSVEGFPVIFAGTRDGNWFMLDGENGQVIWSYQFTGLVHGTVVLDRGLLVSTRSAQVGNGNGQIALFTCDPCYGNSPGDANCDGVLDLADVVFTGNVIDGIVAADSCTLCTADLNHNGAIDEDDYVSVYDLVVCP